MKRRILIYTDSRGQHTPRGAPAHDVYALRLAARPDVDADVVLCPMKWTTTVDFLEFLEDSPAESYDHVVLHTGIVDWSPRPLSSAMSDLYDNAAPANVGNDRLNTREYARKVINNKKAAFDGIFGEDAMRAHFGQDLGVEYEGQPTNNMYGLEMARESLLPRLKALGNLLFVNSNRFVPGWEGDYARGRPRNIAITEVYSELFRDELGAERVVDLLSWSFDEVKKYTCDNIHLTREGSDYIYRDICSKLRLEKEMCIDDSTTVLAKPQRRNNSILIIGNGPSTRRLIEFGLENLPDTLDTFGMGAAYRYYRKAQWWPTYYAWCDTKVVHSHKAALKALTVDPNIPTREFYFSLPISDAQRFKLIQHGSTGDFCFRKAVELGYKNIYLIGIEGDYVEEVEGSRPLSDEEYVRLGFDSLFPLFEKIVPNRDEAFHLFRDNIRIMDCTPKKNPNYFFDDYQQSGDVYSLPRAQTHRNIWKKSALLAKKNEVTVINLSENSKIKEFPISSWDKFISHLSDGSGEVAIFKPYGWPVERPQPMTDLDRHTALVQAGLEPGQKLATLIIGIRLSNDDDARMRNLLMVLDWVDRFYGDLFDVLLMEQDTSSKIDRIRGKLKPYVRHEFIYNPKAYNRGWGYNVAVKHFTQARVVALLDTDVLTGANFVQEVIDCHLRYKAASPYRVIYYANIEESRRIIKTFDISNIRSMEGIKKPTTISGGIVIIRRDIYIDISGFEQYIEFAGEDRSLDVTLLNICDPGELRVAPYVYIHLYHPTGRERRLRWKELFAHLHDNYGCRHDPSLTPEDDIHKTCTHVSRAKTIENMRRRRGSFGDLELYRSGRPLTINGCYADMSTTLRAEQAARSEVIFPPAFKNLDRYPSRELYDAPEPDSVALAKLYNAYKGERCFIIGNGPSLNRHDLSLLKDEYTFGVNSIFYKTDETGFRPTFFVVEDDAVMHENIDRIRSYQAPYKFFPTNYRNLHGEGRNVIFFRMNRGFYEKSSPNYCVPRFSTDASRVVYCGQSVTYINMQLAYFMGFTEVYLIGMDFDYVIPEDHKRNGDFILSTTDDPNHFHKDYFGVGKTWKDPKLERVAANYRQAKLVYDAVGRHIYNATIGGKLEIFDRVNYHDLLSKGNVSPAAASALLPNGNMVPHRPDMRRSDHARVIETKVVSKLLEDRIGPEHVMLDVGAHVGLTASYFHELGWTIHCFEPDANNRKKLLELYRGKNTVTIDARAVSDKSERGVAFYTSAESTGISGLSAFRDTHVQSAMVDVTTIAEVAVERGISHVDFVKIDVEGFDFSVLKGIPWDHFRPDVIECEFEDAKTVPMGHTWKDMAEYLREKGYSIYISEWHPIVRYGIAHDWRRIVPYTGQDIPSDAWGNLLAFREDPSYAVVLEAFDQFVHTRPEAPQPTATTAPRYSAMVRFPAAKRPFYAGFGEWLMVRSPKLFRVLQRARRSLAGDGGKGGFALALKQRAPVLFRAGQVGMWMLRAARRHRLAAAVLALACAALVAAPFAGPHGWAWRFAWWGAAAGLAGLAAAGVVLREIVRRLAMASEAAAAAAVRAARAPLEKRIAAAEGRARAAAGRAEAVAGEVKKLAVEMRAREAEAGKTAGMLVGEVEKLAAEMRAREAEAEKEAEARETELRAGVDERLKKAFDAQEKRLAGLGDAVELLRARPASLDVVSALRAMRPLLLGGSALAALKEQPEVEHGHALLMAALADAAQGDPDWFAGRTLIEIGSTRERDPRQGSTEKLAIFTALTGMRFVSVDMDPKNTLHARKFLAFLNPAGQAVTAKGEDYLREHAGPFDAVYLDAFDFDHGKHSEERQERYRSMLDTTINDQACWKMHLDCAETIAARMAEGGIVALDDTWTDEEGNYAGKGKLALPFLLDNGFEIIARTRMTVALRRTAKGRARKKPARAGRK